jgi:hypothetical protein
MDITVVMQLIVFGIEQMNPGFDSMEAADLFLKRDELIPFFGVAGNGEAGNRQLDAPLRFNGGGDDCIVSEDLLRFVRIGRFAPDADACGSIIGKLGTTKAEGIGRLADQ